MAVQVKVENEYTLTISGQDLLCLCFILSEVKRRAFQNYSSWPFNGTEHGLIEQIVDGVNDAVISGKVA
jgi:hypothetical protein